MNISTDERNGNVQDLVQKRGRRHQNGGSNPLNLQRPGHADENPSETALLKVGELAGFVAEPSFP